MRIGNLAKILDFQIRLLFLARLLLFPPRCEPRRPPWPVKQEQECEHPYLDHHANRSFFIYKVWETKTVESLHTCIFTL